jgi:hypothetical protein
VKEVVVRLSIKILEILIMQYPYLLTEVLIVNGETLQYGTYNKKGIKKA